MDAKEVKENEKLFTETLMTLDKEQLAEMLTEMITFLAQKGKEHSELQGDLMESRRLVAGILIKQHDATGDRVITLDKNKLDALSDVSIESVERTEDDKCTQILRLVSYSTETVVDKESKKKHEEKATMGELMELLSKLKKVTNAANEIKKAQESTIN